MAGAIEVAGLYLGLSARTDKLEKDLARARAEAKKFTEGVGRDAKQAAASLDQFGEEGTKAARRIATGLTLASSAIKAMGGDVNSKMGETLTVSAKIASAWALGGPVAGPWLAALTAVLEVFGLINAEAEKAATVHKQVSRDLIADAAALAKTANDENRALNEAMLSPLDKVQQRIQQIKLRLNELRSTRDAGTGKFLGQDSYDPEDIVGKDFADRAVLQKKLDELKALIQTLDILKGKAYRIGADEIVKGIQDQAKFETEVATLQAKILGTSADLIPLQEKLAALEREKAIYAGLGKDLAGDKLKEINSEIERTRTLLGLTKEAADATAGREAAKKAETEWKRAMEETKRASEDAAREIRGYFESILSPAFSGLGDLLYDSLTNGGKNAAEILRGTFDNMLRTALNAVTNGLMQTLLGGLGGIFGGGGGGGGSILTSILGGSTGSNPYADFLAGGAQPPALNYIPDIPALARGGTVSRPMVALLGEGGEDEHVVPESKADAFARSRLGGSMFGDIQIHTSGDPERWKEEAVEQFRQRLNTSGSLQGAVRKATRGRY